MVREVDCCSVEEVVKDGKSPIHNRSATITSRKGSLGAGRLPSRFSGFNQTCHIISAPKNHRNYVKSKLTSLSHTPRENTSLIPSCRKTLPPRFPPDHFLVTLSCWAGRRGQDVVMLLAIDAVFWLHDTRRRLIASLWLLRRRCLSLISKHAVTRLMLFSLPIYQLHHSHSQA